MNTHADQNKKLKLTSFNKIISESAYAALSQTGVPLYAEDSSVGTKNEYGENRTPAIFSPYPPATGVSDPPTHLPEKLTCCKIIRILLIRQQKFHFSWQNQLL